MQEIGSLLEIFTSRLNKIKCQYMVTGSVASMYYGEPRYTHDIDLVFNISSLELKALEQQFPLDDFYFPPLEIIQIELTRSLRGHFNIIHHDTGFKADIYTLGNDSLLQWGLLNKRRIQFDHTELFIASPEYVILQKMIYWEEGRSEKHIRDIAAMFATLEGAIDLNIISNKMSSNLQKEKIKEIITQR